MRPFSTGSTQRDAVGIATWAVLAAGVALRIVAYVRRSPLWTDEAALARNVVERSLRDLLLVPLDYGQAAPKGFLFLEWLVTRAFGSSDLAFRFVPFASGIASLVLFLVIARGLLTRAGALAAGLFVSVGYWFLVYSSDTHPYGLDLALSLAALLLALDLRRLEFPRRRVWAFAAFGAVAVWWSHAVVLTLFGLGVALGGVAWHARGLRGAVRQLWPIALLSGMSAAGAAWVATVSLTPTAARYFEVLYRAGMVPVFQSAASLRWLWSAWTVQLQSWHGWAVNDPIWTSLYVALALIGFVSLLRRRTADAIIIGSVVSAFVVVSMAKRYPYDSRFLLASMAVFMLGIGESIGVLADAAWGRARVAARSLAVLLCVPPVFRIVTFPPPYQWSVLGDYLTQIRERWQPDDVVYSTYGWSLELMYHAPRFGLTPRDYILGPCALPDARVSLRAADALRGRRRAWVIVGTGRYFPASPEYGYLRAIGIRRDSLPVRLPGSIRSQRPEPFDIPTAYLFDVSDSTRLARATADTYMVSPLIRPVFRAVPRWSCYGVWSPEVRESGIIPR